MALSRAAEWLADSPLGVWAMDTALAYPIANVVHVLGLVLLLGAIGLVDLRLLGLVRSLPLQPLYRALVPVAAALANILLFRLLVGRAPAEPVGVLARLLAALSLMLWTAAAIAGRWVAYS